MKSINDLKKEYINPEELKNGVFLAARGGGVRAVVAIGVLRALEEAKIPVNTVSGESLSSLVAALCAYGYNAEEILEYFLKYNETITKAGKPFGGRGSIVVEEVINELTNGIPMKDTKIECYINACVGKLLKPELVLFSTKGTPNETLGKACRASASLPLFFGNFDTTLNGKEYSLFDGGLKYNPYIPDDVKDPIVYASFYNYIDYYKIVRYLKRIIDMAEDRANAIVYAPVKGTLITGNNKAMVRMEESGYQTTKRLLRM